jgi:dTDP-4-dehydrorhamnose 3,5-epimerase
MKITKTNVDGVVILEPTFHSDNRGAFAELYNVSDDSQFFPNGIRQISYSQSKANVLRGLHFQHTPLMAKAIRVVKGAALIVNVDLRKSSPTYKQVAYVSTSEHDQRLIYAPGWCARGFYTFEKTEIEYFHDATFNPQSSMTIRWDDPDLMVGWPDSITPIISERDRIALTFKQWESFPESNLL